MSYTSAQPFPSLDRHSGEGRNLSPARSMDDSLRSPLRGRPSDVLRAARYVRPSPE